MSVFIYFAVCAANLVSISIGGAWTWTSPILPQLQSPDPSINPLPRPTTTLEDSLIAGAMNIGTIVTPLFGGLLCEWIGKKKAMMLLTLPMVVSHTIYIVASNVQMFIIARFLMGLTTGAAYVIVPGFLTDISEISNRGKISSTFSVFITFGLSWMLMVGPWMSIKVFSMVNLVIPVIYLVVFGWFVPESPYDLLRQDHEERALQSLQKLRSRTDVDKELTYMREQLSSSSSADTTFRDLFSDKALQKGLIICNGILFFQQMSGIGALLGYMQNIFHSAGNYISPVHSTMIIGVIQIVMNFVCSQVVDVVGRRLLLITSMALVTISLTVFGSYFYFDLPGYVPIASLILHMVFFHIGFASVPWVLLAELFPANYKPRSSSISTIFTFSLTFVISVTFPSISQFMGMAGVFWLYTIFVLIGLGFVVVALPETKGKKYEEIRIELEGSK